jgi:hypothetical protein
VFFGFGVTDPALVPTPPAQGAAVLVLEKALWRAAISSAVVTGVALLTGHLLLLAIKF